MDLFTAQTDQVLEECIAAAKRARVRVSVDDIREMRFVPYCTDFEGNLALSVVQSGSSPLGFALKPFLVPGFVQLRDGESSEQEDRVNHVAEKVGVRRYPYEETVVWLKEDGSLVLIALHREVVALKSPKHKNRYRIVAMNNCGADTVLRRLSTSWDWCDGVILRFDTVLEIYRFYSFRREGGVVDVSTAALVKALKEGIRI